MGGVDLIQYGDVISDITVHNLIPEYGSTSCSILVPLKWAWNIPGSPGESNLVYTWCGVRWVYQGGPATILNMLWLLMGSQGYCYQICCTLRAQYDFLLLLLVWQPSLAINCIYVVYECLLEMCQVWQNILTTFFTFVFSPTRTKISSRTSNAHCRHSSWSYTNRILSS